MTYGVRCFTGVLQHLPEIYASKLRSVFACHTMLGVGLLLMASCVLAHVEDHGLNGAVQGVLLTPSSLSELVPGWTLQGDSLHPACNPITCAVGFQILEVAPAGGILYQGVW